VGRAVGTRRRTWEPVRRTRNGGAVAVRPPAAIEEASHCVAAPPAQASWPPQNQRHGPPQRRVCRQHPTTQRHACRNSSTPVSAATTPISRRIQLQKSGTDPGWCHYGRKPERPSALQHGPRSRGVQGSKTPHRHARHRLASLLERGTRAPQIAHGHHLR